MIEFLSAPRGVPWFASAGTGEGLIYGVGEHRFVPSKEAAKEAWESEQFQELKVAAWETCRVACLDPEKKETWLRVFQEVSEALKSECLNSHEFMSFVESVAYDPESFIEDLPFIGAAAEQIAFPDDADRRFYRRRASAFIAGRWASGWDGSVDEHTGYVVGLPLLL
jgi:hypothetical protein